MKNLMTTLAVFPCLLLACGQGSSSDDTKMSGGNLSTACAYIEHTRSACQGDHFTHDSYNYDRCHDNVTESDCIRNRPSRPDENTSTCYRNFSYYQVSFHGTCTQWRQYQNEEKDAQGHRIVECLIDSHCPTQADGKCVNFHCDCGAHACPQPQPPGH